VARSPGATSTSTFSIDLLVKDQSLMLAEAAQRLVPMPALAAILEVHQSARAKGWGQEDIVAVMNAPQDGNGPVRSGAF
jgi:3-hydroxyisobutyrate dehydrogenase-like beta-hydroxyacid dehydrogenase